MAICMFLGNNKYEFWKMHCTLLFFFFQLLLIAKNIHMSQFLIVQIGKECDQVLTGSPNLKG